MTTVEFPPTEQTPLLSSHEDTDNAVYAPSSRTDSLEWNPTRRLAIVGSCMLLLLILDLSLLATGRPLLTMLQNFICSFVLDDSQDPMRSSKCRESTSGAQFANLQHWINTVAFIPGTLLAIPYGLVAERYGRRIVLLLSLSGLVLCQLLNIGIAGIPNNIAHTLIGAIGIPCIIGGGPSVARTIIYAVVADASTARFRATAFFFLEGSSLTAYYLGYLLSPWLMSHSERTIAIIGLGGLVLCCTIETLLPETHVTSTRTVDLPPVAQQAQSSQHQQSYSLEIQNYARYLIRPLPGVLRNRHVTWLLGAMVFYSLGGHIDELMTTMAVANGTWEMVGTFVKLSVMTGLPATLIVLPILDRILLQYYNRTPIERNLFIAKVGITAKMIGSLLLGVPLDAWISIGGMTIPFFLLWLLITILTNIFSVGFSAAFRSLITNYAHGENIAVLYSVMTVIENLGTLIAGPITFKLYWIGYQIRPGDMNWSPTWVNLPLLGAAALLVVAVLIVFLVKLAEVNGMSEREDQRANDTGDEAL